VVEAETACAFSETLETSLALRGFSTASVNNDILSRERLSISRDLSIINRTATNSALGLDALADTETVEESRHSAWQELSLADKKLSLSFSNQQVVLDALWYNSSVLSATLQYEEYKKIITVELIKLEQYAKQLRNYEESISGNDILVKNFEKQVGTVKQVIESAEQSMRLFELETDLVRANLEVTVSNIESQIKLTEGLTGNTENSSYATETKVQALTAGADVEYAYKSSLYSALKTNLLATALSAEQASKNLLISTENTVLTSIASSVLVRAQSILDNFSADNLRAYTSIKLARLGSDISTMVSGDENTISTEVTDAKLAILDAGMRQETSFTSEVIASSVAKSDALQDKNDKDRQAAELLQQAQVCQELMHTIISE
jgi:hypothetical protein